MTIEAWIAGAAGTVLALASWQDLSTRTISDAQWIIVALLGVGHAVAAGAIFQAFGFAAILFSGGMILVAAGRWGSGDALMIPAVGLFVPDAQWSFLIAFMIGWVAWSSIYQMMGRQAMPLIPVHALAFGVAYIGII